MSRPTAYLHSSLQRIRRDRAPKMFFATAGALPPGDQPIMARGTAARSSLV